MLESLPPTIAFTLGVTAMAAVAFAITTYILPKTLANATADAFGDNDVTPADVQAKPGWRLTRWLETHLGIVHAHVPERRIRHEDQTGVLRYHDDDPYVLVYDRSYLVCTECGDRLRLTGRSENKQWHRLDTTDPIPDAQFTPDDTAADPE